MRGVIRDKYGFCDETFKIIKSSRKIKMTTGDSGMNNCQRELYSTMKRHDIRAIDKLKAYVKLKFYFKNCIKVQ